MPPNPHRKNLTFRSWGLRPGADADDPVAAALLDRAFARFLRFCEGYTPALLESWKGPADTITRRSFSARDLFLGPLGTPAFLMLVWLADYLSPDNCPPEALDNAAEAMLCAYFAVRCQDDRLDNDADPLLTYLEHLLIARTARLLVRCSGTEPGFLAEWEQQVADFAEASTLDARMRLDPGSTWDEATVELQGRKFLPMAGPLSALCWRAGDPAAIAGICRTVEALGTGLQLANDLFNAPRDLENGIRSPFLSRLGLLPGFHGTRDLAQAVSQAMSDRSMDFYLAQVMFHYRQAAAEGKPFFGLPLEDHVEHRILALKEAAFRTMARLVLPGKPAK